MEISEAIRRLNHPEAEQRPPEPVGGINDFQRQRSHELSLSDTRAIVGRFERDLPRGPQPRGRSSSCVNQYLPAAMSLVVTRDTW